MFSPVRCICCNARTAYPQHVKRAPNQAWARTPSQTLLQPSSCIFQFKVQSFQKASFKSGRRSLSSVASNENSTFIYKAAAAYSGKKNVFDQDKHYYDFNAMAMGNTPQEQRTKKAGRIPSGQDSFFISSIGASRSIAFGVADGVGGWQDQGIDSADFAHGLCANMKKVASNFSSHESSEATKLRPLQLLKDGYSKVCSDRTIVGGGSTACLAIADPDGGLEVANLGDSGFIQMRLNAVHFYSNPQTHAFNTPFQLSRLPPKILAQIENFGGTAPFSDMPADASISIHRLRHADVLVFATDGVWDNLTSQEILDQVSTCMLAHNAWIAPDSREVKAGSSLLDLTNPKSRSKEAVKSLQANIALDIVASAKAASVNPRRDGPFAKAVQQAYPGERFSGGKIDDICVVVVIALDKSAL